MFFKSKQHADKLDQTLTTKLDKIFQYFKAKQGPSEWLFARNHEVAPWQSQPIGIMVKPI